MTTTLFDQNESSQQNNESASHLDTLVGDGKKFKTVEDLAKGKVESDRFIEQLQSELDGLRSDLATRARLEDLLDQIEPKQNTNSGGNQAPRNDSTPAPDIEKLIENTLTRRERERTIAENILEAKTRLQEIYGSEYVQKLEARAQQLGMTPQELDELAAKSPKALLALVTPQPKGQGTYTPPASAINAPLNSEGGVRNWAYYQRIKAANATQYWSPKVQNQMHKDAIAQAEDFYK